MHRKREHDSSDGLVGCCELWRSVQWIRITVHRFRAEHERSLWLTAQGEAPPPISERQGRGRGTEEETWPIVSAEGRSLLERYDNIRWFIARSVHCSAGGKVFACTYTLVLYVFCWERWFAWGNLAEDCLGITHLIYWAIRTVPIQFCATIWLNKKN